MSKQERTRKSSPQNRVKSFQEALVEVEPTSELDIDERERFDAIIASRERSTWTPADINTATHLAQIEVERDRTREAYQEIGVSIEDHNGKPVVNPLFTVYNYLYTQANRTRRDLGLSASQRAISGHKQAKRNQQDSAAKSKISSLIARPNG
jgi:hypothetical protein